MVTGASPFVAVVIHTNLESALASIVHDGPEMADLVAMNQRRMIAFWPHDAGSVVNFEGRLDERVPDGPGVLG